MFLRNRSFLAFLEAVFLLIGLQFHFLQVFWLAYRAPQATAVRRQKRASAPLPFLGVRVGVSVEVGVAVSVRTVVLG